MYHTLDFFFQILYVACKIWVYWLMFFWLAYYQEVSHVLLILIIKLILLQIWRFELSLCLLIFVRHRWLYFKFCKPSSLMVISICICIFNVSTRFSERNMIISSNDHSYQVARWSAGKQCLLSIFFAYTWTMQFSLPLCS
jgi:hypothetical protein